MDRADVMAWVTEYVRAWHDDDVTGVERLFTEQAHYRPSPYDESEVGHDAIRAFWLDDAGRVVLDARRDGGVRGASSCSSRRAERQTSGFSSHDLDSRRGRLAFRLMAGHVGSGRLRMSEVAALLGGATALAGSWVVVAASGAVPEWEADSFELVNGLPDALWPVLWVPMQLGSIGGSLVVVALTALVSRNVRLTVAPLAAEQVTFWGAKVVKRLVERGRPSSLLADVDTRENLRGLGYLSGHAAIAAALATVLIPSLPRRWQWVAVAAACVVALGRLYSGAHLPLDVIGGAGFGVVCGILARWALGLGGDDEESLHRPFAQPATAR